MEENKTEVRGRARTYQVPVRKRRSKSLPSRPTCDNLPLQPNWHKLQQVLDYSHSLDKLSQVIGLDMEAVKDIKTMQTENEMNKARHMCTVSRASQKALDVLGHDPSTEKVKKTLGLGERELEKAQLEKLAREEHRLQKKRAMTTPYNKKQSSKAMTTLGFDPSMYRSMKRLGIEEESVRQALIDEQVKLEKKIQQTRNHLASRNRKTNRKALTIIGFDPSKEKIVSTLGEEAVQEYALVPYAHG
jgi:hypothetical protein